MASQHVHGISFQGLPAINNMQKVVKDEGAPVLPLGIRTIYVSHLSGRKGKSL